MSKARTSPMHSASCKFSVLIFLGFVGVVASMLFPAVKHFVTDAEMVAADPGAFFDVDGS